MPRVLIDTSYLLPAAGIGVEGVPADAIRRIKTAGHEVLASEVSLFEVLAKGAKLASQGKADPGRVSLAIKSIMSDHSIGKVGAFAEDTMAMAIELRAHHADFVDCVIVASAANECDALVTEDAGIPKNDGLMKAVLRRKPGFRTLTLKALLARER
ncbi:MAG TPA: PIN domain-containing protein [Nitrososphaerales archaeon]|nr:PIN domain-containing protein [Nitrososphaerales archaeon]